MPILRIEHHPDLLTDQHGKHVDGEGVPQRVWRHVDVDAETAAPRFASEGQGLLSEGELGAAYRSNGNARSVSAAATLAGEQISLSYRGTLNQSENYQAGGDFRNGAATGRVGHVLASKEVGSTAYETRTHTLGLAVRGGAHLIDMRFGFQEVPQQLYPNQRMDMLDNQQKRANLRYLGQFDWGQLEARAYHEQVDHMMDFGADKRYWYGTASGGSTAANGVPCSPISATCAAGMPMYTRSETTGFNLKADIALGQTDLLRLGGAAYLLWMAWNAWHHPGQLALTRTGAQSLVTVFRRSALNSLLNPKALLFFLVFLPQFVEASDTPVALQLALLGGVLTIASVVFHGALGLVGGQLANALSARLAHSPRLAKLPGRMQALVLAALAVRLLLTQRPTA